jgi:hypothetical protein
MSIQILPGLGSQRFARQTTEGGRLHHCCRLKHLKKLLLPSNNGTPGITQNQQIATAIASNIGGRTYFGNAYIYAPNYRTLTGGYALQGGVVQYLGKTEGQPGGIQGPLRNRF